MNFKCGNKFKIDFNFKIAQPKISNVKQLYILISSLIINSYRLI